MNIHQSSIKSAALGVGVLLVASTLSCATSARVSAQLNSDFPLPQTLFSFCPRESSATPPWAVLIPTRVQLIEQRDEFGAGVQQKLFISVRNEGKSPYFSKNALIGVTVNGTSYTGIIYGSATAQHQLGGKIPRCETGGIALKDTFPNGTFQRGQSVKVGVPSKSGTHQATLTIR